MRVYGIHLIMGCMKYLKHLYVLESRNEATSIVRCHDKG
jgi:hypothetical protein